MMTTVYMCMCRKTRMLAVIIMIVVVVIVATYRKPFRKIYTNLSEKER